jgi:hypothetical protein
MGGATHLLRAAALLLLLVCVSSLYEDQVHSPTSLSISALSDTMQASSERAARVGVAGTGGGCL